MSFRIKTVQLPNGKWAVLSTKNTYYTNTVRDTELESKVVRLHMIGQDAQRIIDRVDRELQKLGAYDESDPHDYLA